MWRWIIFITFIYKQFIKQHIGNFGTSFFAEKDLTKLLGLVEEAILNKLSRKNSEAMESCGQAFWRG